MSDRSRNFFEAIIFDALVQKFITAMNWYNDACSTATQPDRDPHGSVHISGA